MLRFTLVFDYIDVRACVACELVLLVPFIRKRVVKQNAKNQPFVVSENSGIL